MFLAVFGSLVDFRAAFSVLFGVVVGIPVAYCVLVVKAPFSGGSTALRLSDNDARPAPCERGPADVRQAAVQTLGQLPPSVLAAHVDAIQKAAKEDKDGDVRKAAVKALTKLQTGSE